MKHLLSIGFRPFFFLAACGLVFFPMYLVTIVINGYPYPGGGLGPFVWHGHEIIFGVIPGLLGGFLLTSSTHWTGSAPLKNLPLLGLVALWLATRFIVFFGQDYPLVVTVSSPLFICFLLLKLVPVLKGNRNFYPVCGLLLLLASGGVAYIGGEFWLNEEVKRMGLTFGSMAIFFFLYLFSGRLVPFFTNSKFGKQIVSSHPVIEVSGFVLSLLVFSISLLAEAKLIVIGILSLLTTVLLIVRTLRFYHPSIWKEPMVFSLFISHVWFPIFFGLKAFESFYPEWAVGRSSLHALFLGVLGHFALSIMMRASLGHTGRKIEASLMMKIIFICVTIGATLRVFVPLFQQDVVNGFLHISMGFWTTGFLLFLFKFTPYYMGPRADGQ